MGKYRYGMEVQGIVRIFTYLTLANGQTKKVTLFSDHANGSEHAEHIAQELAEKNKNVVDPATLIVEFVPYPEIIDLVPRRVVKVAG